MVITPLSFGGECEDLIITADLVRRAEMFRFNTLRPTLSGDEVMASGLTSARFFDPTATTNSPRYESTYSLDVGRRKQTIVFPNYRTEERYAE